MTSHIPDQGEQMVFYYGFYSNVFRGLRQKENMYALFQLQSMEILYEPLHLLVGQIVEFFL